MSKPIYKATVHHPLYCVTVRTNSDGLFVVTAEHLLVGNKQQDDVYDNTADAIEAADALAEQLRNVTLRVAQVLAAKGVTVKGMGAEEILEACERGDISI